MTDHVTIAATGVLFDCDGVLVDFDASVLSAWTRWALRYDQDPGTIEQLVHGRRAADTVESLIGADRRAAALSDINAFEVEDAVTVKPIPGAANLVGNIPRQPTGGRHLRQSHSCHCPDGRGRDSRCRGGDRR